MAVNTVVTAPNETFTDAAGNTWYFQRGQVQENGVTDKLTNNVVAMAIVNNVVWQLASGGLWYAKVGNIPGSYDGWAAGTSKSPLTPLQSPDGSVIVGGGSNLVDSHGNLWWIANGQVVENGKVDTLTSNVTEMALKGGVIWQENSSNLWYAKVGDVPGSYDGWAAGTLTAPVPVARTWLGGGSNLASNPADWSPGSVPKAGDTLTVVSGSTVNVVSNALAGDHVYIAPDATQSYTSVTTFNVSGNAAFSVGTAGAGGGDGTGPVIVNLADHSTWTGGFGAGPYGKGVTIQETGTANFANTTSTIDNSVLINANVIGTGTFTLSVAHGTGEMEFIHGVSAGQTVILTGGEYGQAGSSVQIDDAKDYHASTILGLGSVVLKGLTATSYSLQNDVLRLFKGNSIVDTLALKVQAAFGSPPTAFGVSQVSGDINIHADGHSYGVALPMQT